MVISAAPKVVILDIQDGHERGQDVTRGSGQAMVNALRDTLVSRGIPVNVIQSTAVDEGYQEAERLGFNYVLRGVLTNWEDNATAWSGNPDRATLVLELYGVEEKRLAASANSERQASGATLVSGTPGRFIPELAFNAVDRIFDWEGTRNPGLPEEGRTWRVVHQHTFGSCQGDVLITYDIFQYVPDDGKHTVTEAWDSLRVVGDGGANAFRIDVDDAGSFDFWVSSGSARELLRLARPLVR